MSGPAYRLFFDVAPTPCLVIAPDASFPVVAVNAAWLRVAGKERGAVVGHAIADVVDIDGLRSSLERVLCGAARDVMSALVDVGLPGRRDVRSWTITHLPVLNGEGVVTAVLQQVEEATGVLPGAEQGVAGRVRALLDHGLDAVLVATADGRIAGANRAATDLLGWSEEELLTLGVNDVVDVTDPRLPAALAERRRAGRFRGELTLRSKEGRRVPVELSSAVYIDVEGVEWTVTSVRDISERLAREEERARLTAAVDDERRWLQAILEHVPLAVVLMNANGALSANRRADELFGMPLKRDGGGAQFAHRIRQPDGKPVPPAALLGSRALQTGEPLLGVELVVDHDDGGTIPVLASAAPIKDDSGAVIGAVATYQDISARVRSEEETRAKERLLDGVFELLPVGVWIADQTGRIVRGNPAGTRIWAGARFVGVDQFGEYRGWWADSGKPIAADEWALARALTKGETSIGELLRIQCFDGSFKTIINSALPLYDEERRFVGAVVVNEDVTQLKDIEEALRRAVRVRDDVLGVVAHDLRNPLSGIAVAAQSLGLRAEQRGVSWEWMKPTIATLLRSVERMRRLIGDLLDVASIDAGSLAVQRTRLDTQLLVQDAVEALGHEAAEKRLRLEIAPLPPLQPIYGDRDRLLQVFTNLIGNAVKFTPADGDVVVAAAVAGDAVVFSVSDSGPGIPPEQIDRLFDRFWRANPADRRGAGLGLAIARGIVEAHGGRMWVESTVGHGSTFFFSVPIDRSADERAVEERPGLADPR